MLGMRMNNGSLKAGNARPASFHVENETEDTGAILKNDKKLKLSSLLDIVLWA